MPRGVAATVLAALVVLPAGEAPAQPTAPRPVTWCDKPSREPEWARQTVYLSLAEVDGAVLTSASGDPRARIPTERRRLHSAYLGLLLESVRARFRAQAGLSPLAPQPAGAPPGDARYEPSALLGDVRFVLAGDGTVESIESGAPADSALARDLAEALAAAAYAGELPPFGAAGERHTLRLWAELKRVRGAASWAAFTLEAPRERDATLRTPLVVRFPPNLTGWNASLEFQFVVDADGRVERETVRIFPPPDSLSWGSTRERVAYERFLAEARRAVEGARYDPAEYLGCRMRQLTRQTISFRAAR